MDNTQESQRGRGGNIVISIDLELAWGNGGKPAYMPLHAKERSVIPEFLSLSEQYDVPCTWASVGNLMLRDIEEAKRRNIVFYGKGASLYERIESGNKESEKLWFGEDIIESILSCRTKQELGSHSFFHTTVPEVSEDMFEAELRQARELAKDKYKIDLNSFVHPRNMHGHLGALKRAGFSNYRAKDRADGSSFLTRVLPMFACSTIHGERLPPQAVEPLQIPSSYFLALPVMKKRMPPRRLLIRRLEKSIDALADGEIFHMWFHPHNIAANPSYWLGTFKELFEVVRTRREQGLVSVKTMGDISRGALGI